MAQTHPTFQKREPFIRTAKDGQKFYVFMYVLFFAGIIFALQYSAGSIGDYPFEYLLLFVNAMISAGGQVVSIKLKSPIHFISFLFCYLFMSIMPMMQIDGKIDPIFTIDNYCLLSCIGSLLFTLCGVGSLCYLERYQNKPTRSPEQPFPEKGNYFSLLFLVLGLSICVFALFGKNLFSSRENFGFAIGHVFGDRALAGLVLNFLTLTPFFGAVIGLRSACASGRKGWIATYILLLVIAFIPNNPMVNPRFKVSGLIFFFVDYFFHGKRNKLLVALLLVGISIAPVFQVFRYHTYSMDDAYTKVNYGEKFLSTDYDAFQLQGYTFMTVEDSGIVWGENLLGAILFFVPREWWPEKPAQTSWVIYHTMLKHREVGTNNLSVPIAAEGYFAFGWGGLLLLSFGYWFFMSKITYESQKKTNSRTFLLRCVCSCFVLILLRGPLIVGYTSIIGGVLAALLARELFYFGVQQRAPQYKTTPLMPSHKKQTPL